MSNIANVQAVDNRFLHLLPFLVFMTGLWRCYYQDHGEMAQ